MLFKCYVEIKLPLFKMTTFSGIENSVPYFIEFLGESFVKKNNIHQIKQLHILNNFQNYNLSTIDLPTSK